MLRSTSLDEIGYVEVEPVQVGLAPNRERGLELVKMEFRSFLGAILLLPAQIIRTGRKIIYRILGYNGWIKDFFATWERLRRLEAT